MSYWHWTRLIGWRRKAASRPRRTALVLETLEQKCLPSTVPVGNLPVSVALADFNGDGNLDMVVVNHEAAGTPGSLSVLLGNGDGTFQAPVDVPVSDKPFAVAVGDFNGDGVPGLVVTDGGDSTRTTLNVLLGNGDGTFQSPQTYTVGRDPRAVAVADVNGDGIPDLVTVTMFDGNITVLLGNGDGTFQAPIKPLISGGPVAFALGDVNGDGKLDIVTTVVSFGRVPGLVQVALGNGDGTFRVRSELDIGIGENNLEPKAVVPDITAAIEAFLAP